MRLFVAIEIPESIKDDLIRIQDKIDGSLAKIRLVNKNQIHITLKFLGEVSDNKINLIKEKLKEIKFKNFSLILDKIGVFPNENYIRVIWIGVKPEDQIKELQKNIENSLNEFNLNEFNFKKDLKFHPHITLARVKFVKDKEKFVKNLKEIKTEKKEIEVKDFRLIKSTLTKEGPVYEDLEIFSLTF